MSLLFRVPWPVIGFGMALAVSACAAGSAATVEWRLLVKLASAAGSADAVAERVTQTSGMPARYLSASGGQWHSVALRCSREADCQAALQRLKDDPQHFLVVERDERRRPHEPASSQPS